MSTSFGKIVLRDQTFLEVEAFGVSGSVKLIPQLDGDMGDIAIDDPGQIDLLISLLEIARDHVWKSEEFFQAFYGRELGTFTSHKKDLSDLGGDYLSCAIENMKSIGKEPPQEALKRHRQNRPEAAMGFDKEIQKAVEADGEKLRQLTGEDHRPSFEDYADSEDYCPNCGGEGVVYCCQDEIGCVDPEGGCDWCQPRKPDAPLDDENHSGGWEECKTCRGSGFSGRGTGYDDVCGECGGLKRFPVSSNDGASK
jgi:hypothetical protein